MSLWIEISPGSNEPLYLQIVQQISHSIAKGRLCPGDKLPPGRKLAAELVINPNTVARAYTELERLGLVSTKTGSGTFVTDPSHRDKDSAQINILTERMDNVISQSLNLGLTKADVTDMFKQRLDKFTDNKSGDATK